VFVPALIVRLEVRAPKTLCWVSDGEGRPVSGVLPPCPPLPERPASRVSVRGRDGAVARWEEQMGGVLGSWLAACGPVWGALHRGLGRAEAAGLALVLLVDTEDAALRALPWELLSGSASEPGWEAAGRVVVARLATGIASARPLRGVAAWSPDPTDATTAALLRTHEAERLATGLRAVDEAEPGVLLVAAHGHLLADSLGVSLGDGDSSAVALAEGAAARWAQASGVVLGVCDGAAGTTREIDNLAGRLVALGVPWVVAPAMPVALEAMSAFVAGFYLALSEGRGAALAVAAGRRAIRALSHPHPSHRAHGLQVWVGGRAALSVALPALEGWPQPGASAAGWLVAADDLATTRGDGPVGLEHLLDSLSEGLDGPAMELLHRAEPWRERLRQARLARTRRELVGTDTARIKVIKEGLAPGFSAADLALGLGASPGVPWALAPDSPLGPQTVLTQGTRAAEPGNALVVLGGPEDGRVVRLAAGETLGRAEQSGPDHGLYTATSGVDRRLSRLALQWRGEGKVVLRRTACRVRGAVEEEVGPGPVAVSVGDVLRLALGTWLVVV
jgi:hypothetical protein